MLFTASGRHNTLVTDAEFLKVTEDGTRSYHLDKLPYVPKTVRDLNDDLFLISCTSYLRGKIWAIRYETKNN